MQIHNVYTGIGSSAFSFYDTSPESPNGELLSYVVYPKPSAADWNDRVPGELWVCNHDLTSHRKCADVSLHNHNGACAVWVDNTRLLYTSGNRDIYVIDVITEEILHGPIPNLSETHNCVNHSFVYMTHDHRIVLFDCDTGEQKIITTLEDVNRQLVASGEEPSREFTHVQITGDARHLAFRHSGKRVSTLQISDGRIVATFPGMKPMHFLWYDNETLMGSNWNFDPSDHQPDDTDAFVEAAAHHYYQRFRIDGGVIETLAGSITHGAASPDHNWYAGESTSYGKVPIIFNLYKKGETEAVATIMEHSLGTITWTLRGHVNPSFSRDGKRVYFTQGITEEKFTGSFVDISELVAD